MLPVENFFCSWTEILQGRFAHGYLHPLSLEGLDSCSDNNSSQEVSTSVRLISFTETQLYRNLLFPVLATSEREFVSLLYSLGAGFPAKMLQWSLPISKEFPLQMNLQDVALMQLLWLLSGLYLFTEKKYFLFKIWFKRHRSWTSSL